ncbi:MAG: EamA family transporter [Rhodobacteraceae bacterium]|nr:EamA family transporter [Paracoccaceae bacterium]
MTGRAPLIALLVMLGIGWGVTQPLAKIAVSDGYRHFGLVFWQLAIGAVALGVVSAIRRKGLPMTGPHLRFYVLIALIGTVLPNSASYQAAVYLPAGVISIVISLVPMFAFPIALLMATDRFSWARLCGLLLGLAGVALIVGPEASLPERAMIAWVPVAMIAPAFYALEGNVVAKWGTRGLDPVQVLFGASLIGTLLALPLTLATGQWIDPRPPWGAPDMAVVLAALIHAVVYATYVWLVGRAGAVFAAQGSYLVTGSGVLWAMVLLGESYSGWVSLALGLMFGGLFLVQPRPTTRLAQQAAAGDT